MDVVPHTRKRRGRKASAGRLVPSVLCAVLVSLSLTAVDVRAQAPASTASTGAADEATVETLYSDFLHYSVLGRFQLADSYAQQLLDHPDLDPVQLLKLSEKNEKSMETLLLLIKNSTIAESASRVMEVIQEGEHLQRKDDDRIRTNIDKLSGPPQTEYNATQRLIDSGEYAVPWMIQTLRDPAKEHLRPRVIRALPKIGKQAVGPLVEGLAVSDETVRQTIIYALGELAYARATPYLQALIRNPDVAPESKDAAMVAISRIGVQTGRPVDDSPANEFVRLAEQFYDEHGSVGADVRLSHANVWYWNEGHSFLKAVPVPREIYGAVLAMRCCERALLLDPDHTAALALWLAADIRREARLGMDVESGEADPRGNDDPTHKAGFPRALYFTSSAGPRFAHLALQRGVDDLDGSVALGAIAGLRKVSGASSLIGTEDHKQPLVQALRFPDLVVRIRAALTLGNALPRSQFRGSELVVKVLANALAQTGRRNILVIEPDADTRNRIVGALRDAETEVIGESNVLAGIERARKEFDWLSGIFISSAVTQPQPVEAVADIRERYEIASTPIVLLMRPQQAAVVEQILQSDEAVGAVDATAAADTIREQLNIVTQRVGQAPISPAKATELAMKSLDALRRIVIDGRTVFNVRDAEGPLIAVLTNSADESLRGLAIEVLAPLVSADAQRAIVRVALDANETESLRTASLAGLADSAKRFGNLLEDSQIATLAEMAMNEPNLHLRTAAGYALGALNLSATKANQAVLKFHQG